MFFCSLTEILFSIDHSLSCVLLSLVNQYVLPVGRILVSMHVVKFRARPAASVPWKSHSLLGFLNCAQFSSTTELPNKVLRHSRKLIRASVDALYRDGANVRGDAHMQKSFHALRMCEYEPS